MPFRKISTFAPNQKEVVEACKKPLHHEAEVGLELFNQGEYFLAHEALENAWRVEPEPDRRLYQGILQAGIAYMHARNGNIQGVLSMYERSLRWLAPWPDHCRTIDVGQLKNDLQALVDQVSLLGPERIQELNPNIFPVIKRV